MITSSSAWAKIGLFLFFSLITVLEVFSQNESDERALIGVESGISISKDSLFLLNLRFRMQNRMGYATDAGDDFDVEQLDWRVRRLRLRLDGYLLSPKIQYYVQLGFSKSDLDLEGGVTTQPIRDAVIYYFLTDNLYLGFGQSKLPGNRERVISSGNLQFVDRSIANNVFTIDRDFGVFGYYTLPTRGKTLFLIKGAVSTGEGRNASPGDGGLSYTGRAEFLPFGGFVNAGDYSEGDLEFETTPKLSLGMTINFNKNAARSQGQTGPNLYQGRDQRVFITDMMFKYWGWAMLTEYFNRYSSNPITQNEEGLIQPVFIGTGTNFQFSRMISTKSELAFRYASIRPGEEILSFHPKRDETTLGYSRYIHGHRIKLQGNAGYQWLNGTSDLSSTDNTWIFVFQVEFGI